jgi:hypothetical protein
MAKLKAQSSHAICTKREIGSDLSFEFFALSFA